VGEYVYLRVLPGNEIAVEPDEVSGVHSYSPLSEVLEDGAGGVLGGCIAAEVGRTKPLRQRAVYRRV
jgi:hypothetical protein